MMARDNERGIFISPLETDTRERYPVVTEDVPVGRESLSTLETPSSRQIDRRCRLLSPGFYEERNNAQRVCAARLPGLHWLSVPPPTRTDCPTTGTVKARRFRAVWHQEKSFARAVSTGFIGGAWWLAGTLNHLGFSFSLPSSNRQPNCRITWLDEGGAWGRGASPHSPHPVNQQQQPPPPPSNLTPTSPPATMTTTWVSRSGVAATRWPRNDEREIDRPLAADGRRSYMYLRMYLRRTRSGVERGCEGQEL